jgi:hypothetical protein
MRALVPAQDDVRGRKRGEPPDIRARHEESRHEVAKRGCKRVLSDPQRTGHSIHALLFVDAQLVVGEHVQQECSELVQGHALQFGRRKAHRFGHI